MPLKSSRISIPVRKQRILLFVLLAFVILEAKAPRTWNVNGQNFVFCSPTVTTNNDSGAGSLRSAITCANSVPGADTITFIGVTGTINLLSALDDITDDLTITGPGADQLTVQRNAAARFRIFTITSGKTVSISGLTIKNGFTADGSNGANGGPGVNGGGIFNAGILTLTSCTVSNNVTGQGGSATIAATASRHYGAAVQGGGTGGNGGAGGGIFNQGTLTVSSCTISNNTTGNGGAGSGGVLMVANYGNAVSIPGGGGSGGDGGGIANENGGSTTVTNSTIASNQTGMGGPGSGIIFTSARGGPSSTEEFQGLPGGPGGEGGGLFNGIGSSSTLRNSTVANNSTGVGGGGGAQGGNGGGVYTGNTQPATVLTSKSTIIAKNTVGSGGSGPDVFSDHPISSQGYNLIGNRDGGVGFAPQPTDQTGNTALPLDPLLDPAGLQSNGGPTKTIGLQGTSPAVDRGINSFGLTTDQRGGTFGRTFDNPSVGNAGGDGTDVGAFEIQAGGCAPDTTPPIITCQGSMTKFTDSGQDTATVNPGQPVASDNCALQSVVGVRNDGKALNAPYPIGVTVITWTATDTSGNKASCGQSITVMRASQYHKVVP